MSRTVSFRASEELDEFLEKEAERRMTTKSTVANMLIAERVRQIQSEEGSGKEPEGSVSKEVASSVGEAEDADDGRPDVFDRHPDGWYVPEREGKNFAVRDPDSNQRWYYKTEKGAADRLRQEYE